MAAILRDPPATGSRDADEPPGSAHVIHRLLSKACAERHQTTAALLDDLEALRDQRLVVLARDHHGSREPGRAHALRWA